jgi:hypothetical protein
MLANNMLANNANVAHVGFGSFVVNKVIGHFVVNQIVRYFIFNEVVDKTKVAHKTKDRRYAR